MTVLAINKTNENDAWLAVLSSSPEPESVGEPSYSQEMPKSTKILWAAILSSLILHAAFLIYNRTLATPEVSADGETASQVNVRLVSEAPPAKTEPPKEVTQGKPRPVEKKPIEKTVETVVPETPKTVSKEIVEPVIPEEVIQSEVVEQAVEAVETAEMEQNQTALSESEVVAVDETDADKVDEEAQQPTFESLPLLTNPNYL